MQKEIKTMKNAFAQINQKSLKTTMWSFKEKQLVQE